MQSVLSNRHVVEGRTVAEMLVRIIEYAEIPFVFGIPGGFIAPLLKRLRSSSSVIFVIGRQETGCAFMADGFARMTGKPGVVFVTSGPGALNALTGVACAQMGHSSVMLISGQNPVAHAGLGALQEATSAGVDIVEVFRHATAMSELVGSPKTFRSRVLQAARLCAGLPRRAVHLSFPLDVLGAELDDLEMPRAPGSYALATPVPDPARVRAAFDALVAAKRPLILLGAGCRDALRDQPLRRAALARVVGKLGIPVVTSVQGKGLFPESDPRSFGVHGICGSKQADAYVAAERPDVLMVIGSSLGEWPTKSWDPTWVPAQTLIHVDLDPAVIGRTYPATNGIVGDAAHAIDGLIAHGDAAPPNPLRGTLLDRAKAATSPFSKPERRDLAGAPIAPQRLMRELNVAMPPRTSLFIDNGNCIAWAVHHLQIDPPTEILLSTAMASMGWANGAVVGAKLGAPDRTCICLTGDGSFLMNGVEISTAARYRVGAIWIVLYDNSLGMVNHGEHVTGNQAYPLDDPHYDLGNPDVVGFARALGAEACWIERPGELGPALASAIARADTACVPQVIAARIDPRELPPILDRFEAINKGSR
jgi:acetolactate synthase I/II/III large subunit